jgi:hypothetical protein
MVDYYKILEVEYAASKDEIRAAYRRKIKEYHPDTHPGDEYALGMTQAINEAYHTLIDPVKRAEYDDLLKLYAEQEAKPYVFEESTVEPEIPHYRCQSCGRQDDTLRVSVFLYVISVLVVTYKKPSIKILCSRCRTKYSVLSNISTFLLGWWGFPFGIIYSLEALYKNMFGGIQPPENNQILLQVLGYDLYKQGRYYAAYEALNASQKIKHDDNIEQFTAYLRTFISPTRAEHSRWDRIGRLKPVFVSGPVTMLCFVLALYLLFSYESSEKISGDYPAKERVAALFAKASQYRDVVDKYLTVITDSLQLVSEHQGFSGIKDFYLQNLKLFQETDSACIMILNSLRELDVFVQSKEDTDFVTNLRGFYESLRKEICSEMGIASLLKSNKNRNSLDVDKYELFNSLWDCIDSSRLAVDFYSGEINRQRIK